MMDRRAGCLKTPGFITQWVLTLDSTQGKQETGRKEPWQAISSRLQHGCDNDITSRSHNSIGQTRVPDSPDRTAGGSHE